MIALVAMHDRCDRDSAERQVRDALGDHKLFPLKWEDERINHGLTGGITIIFDEPPRDAAFWLVVEIHGDKIFDPLTRRERVLLISRFAVQQIWKEQPPARTKVDKVKQLLLEHAVDLTMLEKEIVGWVRAHWDNNAPPCPSRRVIGRAISQLKANTRRSTT